MKNLQAGHVYDSGNISLLILTKVTALIKFLITFRGVNVRVSKNVTFLISKSVR